VDYVLTVGVSLAPVRPARQRVPFIAQHLLITTLVDCCLLTLINLVGIANRRKC